MQKYLFDKEWSSMNYEEARAYLDDAARYGSVLGLETMKKLLTRLGNPQDALRFIHIGGTNGKGSVLSYISAVLKEAGYRVGRYISPTLFSYRERIQINEIYIKKEALARLTTQIRSCIDEMVRDGEPHPTAFEIETALCFLYFKEENCDLVVLEVGMGGLEDATNVIQTTVLEVLASISMDHMGFLGNSLAEIAACKAGIIKPGTAVASMRQKPEAMEVIEQTCRIQNAALSIADPADAEDIVYGCEEQSFSYGGYRDLKIHLAGSYQIANAVLAVEAIKRLGELGYAIPEQALRDGLQKAVWRGRFTILQRDPYFIIDGAHNRDGAKVLADSIRRYFDGRRLHYIMGVFKDKEYETIIDQMSAFDADVIAVETPDNPRALPAELLADAWKKRKADVIYEKNIENAVKESLKRAKKDDVILAFGSLSFLGEIVKALDKAQSEV